MANQILNVKICQRTDTEANWANKNPVLLNGEMAISSDKDGRYKLGNGTSKWSELSYAKARMEKSDVTTALGYTPPTKDTTYGVATASANGLMSSTDKKRLDSVVGAYNLGSMTGKTITDLRTALETWLKSYCNIANASAYFYGDANWATLWNASDTTNTIKAGVLWTVRIIGRYDYDKYVQLEISTYSNKEVYCVALSNGSWLSVQHVAFQSDLSSYSRITHTHSQLDGTQSNSVPTTAPGTGVLNYKYYVLQNATGLFPAVNNANGIITLNRHPGNFDSQLGFSSNGNIYYRYFTGATIDTTMPWKQLAFTDSSITGNAATATALTTSAGSATQPVYFSGGKPVACTYTLGKSVPSDAKFTDTNTWRGIQNNLTSTSTTDSLSAAQGKVLNDKFASYVPTSRTVNGKALSGNISLTASDVGAAASSHTHSYAGSSSVGGAANSATKLATARTINGTSFDGTGNITTANWGTTRKIKIGQQSVSINGSQDYSFDLPSIMGRLQISSSGSANNNKWIKFGTIDMSSAGTWIAFSCDIVVEDTENGYINGVLHIHVRTNDIAGVMAAAPTIRWRSLNNIKYELSVSSVKVSDGKYDLYFKPVDLWCSPLFTVVNGYSQQYLTLAYSATYVDSITAASTSICSSVANIVKDSTNGSPINITYGKSGQASTSWLASWNGYELGCISPNNVTVDTATNATKLSGYAASTAASGNTIALRTSNGYINATYFNQSSNAETPTTSSYIIYANSDGYFRKSSLANVKTILGLGSAAYTASSAYAAASHNHNASNINAGTLSSDRLPVVPVTKGGTGQTTLVNSANVLINALSTGVETPKDADYYVSQYVNGGTTTTTYHRRPMSSLWAYVNSKLKKVATSGSYSDLSNKPDILNMVYPVGSIYTSVVNKSPATFIGGTWETFGAGKVLVGVDPDDSDFSAPEKTGGEKTHTLSVAEMPSHSHTVSSHTHSIPALSGTAASATHSHSASFTSGNQSAGHTHTFSATSGSNSANHSHGISLTTSSDNHRHKIPHNTAGFSGSSTAYMHGYDSSGNTNAKYSNRYSGYDAHTHTVSGNTGNQSANHTHSVSGTTAGISANHTHTTTVTFNNGGGHTHSVTTVASTSGSASPGTNSAGSGSAHNNMQPYITVYMWKRIE